MSQCFALFLMRKPICKYPFCVISTIPPVVTPEVCPPLDNMYLVPDSIEAAILIQIEIEYPLEVHSVMSLRQLKNKISKLISDQCSFNQK